MIEQPVGFVGYSASDLAGSAMIPGSEYDSTRYAVQHISGPFILRGQLPLKPSVDSQRPDARHRPPAVPLVSPHSGYGLYTLPPPLVCCRDRGGGGPAPGVAGLRWCGGAGGYAGRRAAGGPLLVSFVSHPGWMMVDTAPTGSLATSMRRGSALGMSRWPVNSDASRRSSVTCLVPWRERGGHRDL
jgi:hypothetical protein